jgi:2-C-methyl-D-erythritol 2,4-cyclodiphosphate synthase
VRVGIGYDSHRFAAGRRLVLGGVEIPHTRGLDGWSDADVVCHALIDAILGAASLGDIGRMFPPDDPQWKDVSSLVLLGKANLACLEYGLAFQQGDVTVIAEEPRLAPYLADMERRIAETLVAGPTHVSVKAKTNEGMGFVGKGEGIAAVAVATLVDTKTTRLSGAMSMPD